MILKGKDLTIPHPRIQDRLFMLMPLKDIKADIFHPVLKKTIDEIIDQAPQDIKKQKIISV
jgi:2-amino-4-hydroxy-6-hydroxymethyldihydropteridine diphosphokinase